jgi:hypothetical protein
MSRLSIFVAAVLLALTATPVAFAKEYHHVRNARQYINAIPRWSYAGPRAPVSHDATPSYDDPSKFGGSEALPVTR